MPPRDPDLPAMRRALLSERRQLETNLTHFEHWQMAQLGYGNALVDDVTVAFDQATQLALRQQTEIRLAQVIGALNRLERGTYGACEGCGQPIPKERLQVLPDARLCVRCQHLSELTPLGRPRRPQSPSLRPVG